MQEKIQADLDDLGKLIQEIDKWADTDLVDALRLAFRNIVDRHSVH